MYDLVDNLFGIISVIQVVLVFLATKEREKYDENLQNKLSISILLVALLNGLCALYISTLRF